MGKIVSCYIPFNVNNKYVDNIKRLLKNNNIEVVSIKQCIINLNLFKKCEIFNFNWFEGIKGNRLQQIVIYYGKVFLLRWLKINNKKIIYTIHNKKPHDIKDDKYSLKMMNKLCDYSDVILGLCPETKSVLNSIDKKYEKKLKLTLHPNYIYNYENMNNDNYRKYFNIKEDDLVFLFFGFVSPYKNLEGIIKIFKKLNMNNIKLLIIGKPITPQYKQELISVIGKSENIKYNFSYIEDSEVFKYYNTSNIVILPYHKDSSLNSGAVYLSFSLKKTVICPEIGTIKALKTKDFIYNYDYNLEEEHIEKLEKIILNVCEEYLENSQKVLNNGIKAYEYVKKYHSDKVIGESYKKIYESLVGKN